MTLDRKSMIIGAVIVVGLAALIYVGNTLFMSGDSGVSRRSSCVEMRDAMQKGQDALAGNPGNRELIKAIANLQNVYAETCL